MRELRTADVKEDSPFMRRLSDYPARGYQKDQGLSRRTSRGQHHGSSEDDRGSDQNNSGDLFESITVRAQATKFCLGIVLVRLRLS